MSNYRYKVKHMPTPVGGFWRVYNHKGDHIANFFTLPEAITYATEQARTREITLPAEDVVQRDPDPLTIDTGTHLDAGDAGTAWLSYSQPTREDLTTLATALLRHAETLT